MDVASFFYFKVSSQLICLFRRSQLIYLLPAEAYEEEVILSGLEPISVRPRNQTCIVICPIQGQYGLPQIDA